ncbi:MAG TPA: hypothetical protein VIL55_07585, partial [Naasia sp.]
MSRTFTLVDGPSVDDLVTYLGRAQRVEDGSVRLIAGSGILAAYTAILYPSGLLDSGPTVLGLRTFALRGAVEFDAVVPMRSLLERLERAREATPDGYVPVGVPTEVSTVTWAGISPPKGGWKLVGETSAGILEEAGRAGIAAVADALPDGTGEQIVRRVRGEIWARPIEGLEHVPAGVGFAGIGLGFLGDPEERIP